MTPLAGRPWMPEYASREDDPDDPLQFDLLTTDEQPILLEWIKRRLKPLHRGRPARGWRRMHSYKLKHVFERDRERGGLYLSNGAMKGALLAAGIPVLKTEPNWDVRAFVFEERGEK